MNRPKEKQKTIVRVNSWESKYIDFEKNLVVGLEKTSCSMFIFYRNGSIVELAFKYDKTYEGSEDICFYRNIIKRH